MSLTGRTLPQWKDKKFFVQIERCFKMENATSVGSSVRHDETKYVRCAQALTSAIRLAFDNMIQVEVVGVSTFYAMEVRVMPLERLPRLVPSKKAKNITPRLKAATSTGSSQGYSSSGSQEKSSGSSGVMVQPGMEATVGQEAELVGGQLISSKIGAKRWPVVDAVIGELKAFCRVDVRLTLLGQEVRATRKGGKLRGVVDAGEEGFENSAEQNEVPLARVDFVCAATNGDKLPLSTSAFGVAEAVLYPGKIRFRFDEESAYDAVIPEEVEVQPSFSLQEITLIATIKKRCTFYVVDQHDRPAPSFPLRVFNRSEPELKPIFLKTRNDGRCRALLKKGDFVAVHGNEEAEDSSYAEMEQAFKVEETDVPQVFKLIVRRVKVEISVMLETRFREPVLRCPFSIRRSKMQHPIARGITTDLGLARADILPGKYELHLESGDDSPYVAQVFGLVTEEDGSFSPTKVRVATKVVDVNIFLITPDGEPANACSFSLEPNFPEPGPGIQKETMLFTDEAGVTTIRMGLLEPHTFKIKEAEKGVQEYMPQIFVFQTATRTLTAVVARSIFGSILEDKIALVLDTSGSMSCYMDEIRKALYSVLFKQFHGSEKFFNIIAYTSQSVPWRPTLSAANVPENISDALRFVSQLCSGGGSDLLHAVEHAFRSSQTLDAIYLISDGKQDINQQFIHKVEQLYASHPNRPKVNAITLNCVPRRRGWRYMQQLSILSRGIFRAVCLEQDLSHLAQMNPQGALKTSDDDVT